MCGYLLLGFYFNFFHYVPLIWISGCPLLEGFSKVDFQNSEISVNPIDNFLILNILLLNHRPISPSAQEWKREERYSHIKTNMFSFLNSSMSYPPIWYMQNVCGLIWQFLFFLLVLEFHQNHFFFCAMSLQIESSGIWQASLGNRPCNWPMSINVVVSLAVNRYFATF